MKEDGTSATYDVPERQSLPEAVIEPIREQLWKGAALLHISKNRSKRNVANRLIFQPEFPVFLAH